MPVHTGRFAAFMHKIGAIQNQPADWKDYFFEDIHDQPGS